MMFHIQPTLTWCLLLLIPSTVAFAPNANTIHYEKIRTRYSSSKLKSSKYGDMPIRYLGKGSRAVVREGVALVAPNHEYNHFLMRSVVFIHAIGLDEYDEVVARGVIIDHPTAFTMGEMGGGSVVGVLGHNILFRGGDSGNDSAILLHSCGGATDGRFPNTEVDDECRIDCGEMIGSSGVYEGGVQAAMDIANEGLADAEHFKFFFNYMEFTEKELDAMLNATDSDGDAWVSLEVSPKIILGNHQDRGDAWSYLRNQIKQMVV